MSHSVTITRTTTTSSTTAILLNTGYLGTLGGLLKLAQTILGAVCVGLAGYYRLVGETPYLFFFLMVVAFLIPTFCLLISSLISISTASFLPKTVFEVMYHFVGFALLLAASLTLLIALNNRRYYYYEGYMAAAIIGLINTVLYFISTVLAFRSYRGIGI